MPAHDPPPAAVDATIADGDPITLRLSYDGAAPPLALMAELRAHGWEPLVPMPPPADAIDWTERDPTKPGGYAIRSYAATSRAELRVPRERRQAAVALARATIERATAASPSGVGTSRTLHITVPPSAVDRVRAQLAQLATLTGQVERTAVRRTSYRGRVADSATTVHVLQIRIDPAVLPELARAIEPFTAEPVLAGEELPAEPADTAAPAAPHDAGTGPVATLVVVGDLAAGDRLRDHLAAVGAILDERRTERVQTVSYRTITQQRRVPQVEFRAAIPVAGVEDARAALDRLGASDVGLEAPPATSPTPASGVGTSWNVSGREPRLS